MEEINYWLFSDADQPRFARARNDIPPDIVSGVTDEEAEQICAKTRERLESGKFYEIWVKVLAFFNDKSALELLRKLEQYYQEKDRIAKRFGGGYSPWIHTLKEAIKHLERL